MRRDYSSDLASDFPGAVEIHQHRLPPCRACGCHDFLLGERARDVKDPPGLGIVVYITLDLLCLNCFEIAGRVELAYGNDVEWWNHSCEFSNVVEDWLSVDVFDLVLVQRAETLVRCSHKWTARCECGVTLGCGQRSSYVDLRKMVRP